MHKRFIEIREKLGFNQTNFAEKLSLKPFNIRDIEKGKQKIPIEVAEILEEKFSINGWWLLTGKGEMFIKEEFSQIGNDTNKNDIELIKNLKKLPQKKQEYYQSLIKTEALKTELNDEEDNLL